MSYGNLKFSPEDYRRVILKRSISNVLSFSTFECEFKNSLVAIYENRQYDTSLIFMVRVSEAYTWREIIYGSDIPSLPPSYHVLF